MINHQASVIEEDQPQPTTRQSIFRKGVYSIGLGSIVNIICLFLETIVAVRLLSAEIYGVYVLLVAVVNFFVTIVDFGCKTAVVQFISSSDHNRQAALANSTLIFRLLVIAVISVFIWLAQDMLRFLDPTGELAHFTSYIPLMLAVASLDELLLAELQGFQSFRHMTIAQIVRSLVRLCLSIFFLVVLKLGLNALIFSWVISFTISSVYQYIVLPISKRIVLQLSSLKEMLHFGFPIQLDRILWYGANRLDVLLLGMFVGPTGVAFYNIAVTIPSSLVRLTQSYVSVFFPMMAALLAKERRKEATWMLDHSLRLCSFAGALAALVAVVFSKEIITLLFSAKYIASSMAFSLLMMAFHMTFLVTLTGYTLTAAGFPKRSLGQNTVNVVLTVLVDLLLIPPLGFIGPAFAQVISSYAANPVSVWLLRRSDIRITVAHYVKQIVLLWIGAALFWWTRPDGFAYKLAIVALFVVINSALATISVEDLKLILPDIVIRRLSSLKEVLLHDRKTLI
jgi:O-antigen/teichoic acid export membrane protein